MIIFRAFVASFAILAALPAAAGSFTDAVGSCFADNTNGKERKELARWMFIAIAAHPEMKDLATTTGAARDSSFQSVGVLVTRLFSENCAVQVRSAMEKEGSGALGQAWESLGILAMHELSSNPEVKASLLGFERYVDRKKMASALTSK